MKKLKLYGLINSSVQGKKHTIRHQYISFLIYDSCHSCYPFFILFFSISLPPSLLFISFPPCLLHLPAIIAASSQLHCCCLLLPFVSPPPTVMYHHIFSLSAASSLIFSSFSSSSLTSSPRSPPLTS